jgi:hypothetical protein
LHSAFSHANLAINPGGGAKVPREAFAQSSRPTGSR